MHAERYLVSGFQMSHSFGFQMGKMVQKEAHNIVLKVFYNWEKFCLAQSVGLQKHFE